ncbi:MAG: VOC family protein [Planctomycetes bacterium]|nr:VOC family protein [Planctomycetota bacterium]
MAKNVKAIPEGFHSVTPHLIVRGAAKAIDFYKKAFGAEEVMRMPGPDGKSLMHAELKIGNSHVMLCDEAPDWGAVSPQALNGSPVSIHLYVEDVDAVYDRATKAGAKPTMPITDMFWGDRFGKLTDPFGHHWSVATHKEDVPPEECMKRAATACK